MADAFAGDLSAWIQSLPPVTRSWLVCSFLITAAVTLDFIPEDQLIFDFDKICNNLELWRFLTSFCYCGGRLDEFHSLTLLYLVYIESRRYEQNPYPVPGSGGDGSASRTIDCAFCYLFCALGLLLTYPIAVHYFGVYSMYPYFTLNLAQCSAYVWSKRNANARIQFNVFPMEGRYLPLAHVAFSLALNQRVSNEIIHGFAVGHLYYYFIEVLPTVLGRPVLRVPHFFTLLIGGGEIVPEQQQNNSNNNHDNNRSSRQQQQFVRDHQGGTRAHILAKEGNLEDLRNLSRLSPEIFHVQDNNSWQPLHEAVRGGFLDIINFLVVEQNANINARTGHQGRGPSALWWAESFHGLDHAVTRRLAELGADRIPPDE